MKEEFLHFLWKYKLFNTTNLKSIANETIKIIKSGLHNQNTGPDFLTAHLKINNQLWIGNVEIHINSSDWYLHKHEEDKNYEAIILHVVWQHDTVIFMKNNKPLPTLQLKDFIDIALLENYQKLFSKKSSWILCENQINSVDTILINNWLEKLYLQRLERKSVFIKDLLSNSNNNYEAVLFQLLAKNFGLKINGDSFLRLSQSFDFSVLRKTRFNELELSALLFGQAGFFEDEIENEYFIQLKNEYNFISHKHNLTPISNNLFQFFRMRPTNFPTIRIAQLVALFHKHQNLFSQLIETKKIADFYKLFSVEVNDFWKIHYTFETESKKSSKKITKSFIDLLLINTIIPLKYIYEKNRGEVNEADFFDLIKQLKSEKNTIISKFSDLKIKSENALKSQALLELKNNYCTDKHCLQCDIGKNLLYK
ncbi:DUF2851 family protein [Tenacibaculum dicentrarchi]|uniref:DUF2851 family protein n=1 Tax=Tenacibaculum dicentrarchi TaxID=669041 RepID=UPI0035149487